MKKEFYVTFILFICLFIYLFIYLFYLYLKKKGNANYRREMGRELDVSMFHKGLKDNAIIVERRENSVLAIVYQATDM